MAPQKWVKGKWMTEAFVHEGCFSDAMLPHGEGTRTLTNQKTQQGRCVHGMLEKLCAMEEFSKLLETHPTKVAKPQVEAHTEKHRAEAEQLEDCNRDLRQVAPAPTSTPDLAAVLASPALPPTSASAVAEAVAGALDRVLAPVLELQQQLKALTGEHESGQRHLLQRVDQQGAHQSNAGQSQQQQQKDPADTHTAKNQECKRVRMEPTTVETRNQMSQSKHLSPNETDKMFEGIREGELSVGFFLDDDSFWYELEVPKCSRWDILRNELTKYTEGHRFYFLNVDEVVSFEMENEIRLQDKVKISFKRLIVISYQSSKEKEAKELTSLLERWGYLVWSGDRKKGGQNWREVWIAKADQADLVVF